MRAQTVPFDPSLAPEVTRLTNRHMRVVPPGWELSEQQVADTVAAVDSLWRHHYPDGQRGEQETFCLAASGRLAAAAQLTYLAADPADGDSSPEAHLEWAVADADLDDAAGALFDEIIAGSRARRCRIIRASGRWAFGVGWIGIPVVWPHLIDAALQRGFQAKWDWVIMTGDIDALAVPAPATAPGDLAWQVDEQALEWNLEIRQADGKVAECDVWGIPPHLVGCAGSEEWTTVEWIGVEEAFRRRGVGRFLMQEQARLHARRGIRHLVLWTETDNAPMRMFAESLGFSYGPRCLRLQRKEE